MENGFQPTIEDDIFLYRKEFYILWRTGIKDEPIKENVLVCIATLYEGKTTIIRNFNSLESDNWRAEDKFLAWLSNDPYVAESSTLDLELVSNVSPLFPFSTAFSDLIKSYRDQQKIVSVEFKMVRLQNVDEGDDDADDNKDGLRILYDSGIKLTPVSGKDWGYLRQILRQKKGLVYQEENFIRVRKKLSRIIKDPTDAQTSADLKLGINSADGPDAEDSESATD